MLSLRFGQSKFYADSKNQDKITVRISLEGHSVRTPTYLLEFVITSVLMKVYHINRKKNLLFCNLYENVQSTML